MAMQHGIYHTLVREVTKFSPNLRSWNIDQMQCTAGPLREIYFLISVIRNEATPSQPLHTKAHQVRLLTSYPHHSVFAFRNQMSFKRVGIHSHSSSLLGEPLWSAEEAAPLSRGAIPTHIPSLNQETGAQTSMTQSPRIHPVFLSGMHTSINAGRYFKLRSIYRYFIPKQVDSAL